jgi:hypothetical protein
VTQLHEFILLQIFNNFRSFYKQANLQIYSYRTRERNIRQDVEAPKEGFCLCTMLVSCPFYVILSKVKLAASFDKASYVAEMSTGNLKVTYSKSSIFS